MNADRTVVKLDQLTGAVIGCAFRVHNTLGCGFLEKVYENALAHELRKAGVPAIQQHPVKVRYDGVVVGDYIADLFVDRRLIIELKAQPTLDDVVLAQTLNYLRAAGHSLGLVLNFGQPRLAIKRVVHQHRRD